MASEGPKNLTVRSKHRKAQPRRSHPDHEGPNYHALGPLNFRAPRCPSADHRTEHEASAPDGQVHRALRAV